MDLQNGFVQNLNPSASKRLHGHSLMLSKMLRRSILLGVTCTFFPVVSWSHGGVVAANAAMAGLVLISCIIVGIALLINLSVVLINKKEYRDASLVWLVPTLFLSIWGIFLFYLFEPDVLSGIVGAQLLLIISGLILYFWRERTERIIAFGCFLLFLVASNFIYPKLIDFQDRIYVDNFSSLGAVSFESPDHWRVLELEDGRRLLDLTEYPAIERRLVHGFRSFKSKLGVIAQESTNDPTKITLFIPRYTSGTWGWASRPKAFLKLPLLGEVIINRFTAEEVGQAVLLTNAIKIDDKYLYEALDFACDDSDKSIYLAGMADEGCDPYTNRAGHKKWIKELLDRGCDPNYVDPASGSSVLQRAIFMRYVEPVDWLLQAGANVNFSRADDGQTPLHAAVWKNSQVTIVLLDYGADVTAKNKYGATALDEATYLARSNKKRGPDGTLVPNTESSQYKEAMKIIELLETAIALSTE